MFIVKGYCGLLINKEISMNDFFVTLYFLVLHDFFLFFKRLFVFTGGPDGPPRLQVLVFVVLATVMLVGALLLFTYSYVS